MPPVTDLDLLLFAADALEPGPTRALRDRLAADPVLRRRHDRLRAAAAATLVEPPATRWRIPPPGVALAPLLQPTPHLAAAAGNKVRVGDSFSVWFDTPPHPDRVGAVLLARHRTGWEVISPALPHEARCVADLAQVEGDRCRIELIAHPPVGHQRWAVALHALPLPQGDADDPWAPLRAAVESGAVSIGAVEIDVCDQGDA